MKKLSIIVIFLCVASVTAWTVWSQTFGGLNNQPVTLEGLKLIQGQAATIPAATTFSSTITASGLTASLPVFTDASKGFVSKTVANTKIALGIQAGTAITAADGTVTNTFATAFASAPIVVVTPTVATTTLTNIVISTSASAFVYNAGSAAITVNWIAVGAP